MNKMPWFRAYTEMVDDEKLRLLAFEDRWHFVALLCLKGQGILDGDDPLMMRKVAVKLGIDMRTLEEVIRRLAEVGLIDGKTLQPLAWESRQMRSDADPTNAERQRRYRERKSAESVSNDESNALRNAPITPLEEDTDTDKEEEKEKNKPAPAARARPYSAPDLIAMGVDEQVADEFLQIRKRKRAPLTPLALDGIRREAGRADITLDAALRKCVERGWQSFEAGWVTNDKASMAAGASRHGNFAKQDYHAGIGADGSF